MALAQAVVTLAQRDVKTNPPARGCKVYMEPEVCGTGPTEAAEDVGRGLLHGLTSAVCHPELLSGWGVGPWRPSAPVRQVWEASPRQACARVCRRVHAGWL